MLEVAAAAQHRTAPGHPPPPWSPARPPAGTNATRKWMPGLMFALDGVNIYILFAARNNAQQTTWVAHTQLTVLRDEMRQMLTDQDRERLAIVDDQVFWSISGHA